MKIAIALLAALLLAAPPCLAQDQAEVAFWETVKDSKNPEEIQAYIDGYPAGKFVPLARIRLRALQGGAGAAPAQPAPARPASAPVPAAAPAPAASATGFGRIIVSNIGGIALIQSPQRSEDAALRTKILAGAPSVKCSDSEVYAWQVADQQKLDAIVGATAQAMKLRGYNVEDTASANSLVFAAVNVVPKVKDPRLYGVWSLQPNGVNLLLCRPEK